MARPSVDMLLIWLFLCRLATSGRWGAFCRLWQRHRIVGQGVEIIDHMGALLGARQPGERHRRSRNITAWIGQELVEFVETPIPALAFHRRRVVKACFGCARAVHDVPQIRSDPIWTTFLKGMAGLTLLGGRLALFH